MFVVLRRTAQRAHAHSAILKKFQPTREKSRAEKLAANVPGGTCRRRVRFDLRVGSLCFVGCGS